MSTEIDNIGLGHKPDFETNTSNGQTQIAYFNTVADKTLFTTSCPSSSSSLFYQDVWVPGHSAEYQSLVGCQGKIEQNATTCNTSISNVSTCPSSRCIHTFSIISWYYRGGNINSLVTDTNSRYGSTCTPFNDYLTNFHTNYVKEVNDKIGDTSQDSSDTNKLAGRFITSAKTPVQALTTDMTNNVQPLFSEVYGNLTTTLGLDSIFNP